MIVRDRPGLFQLFFIVRGSIIRRILPQIVVIFLLSALIVWGHEERPNVILSFNGSPFALLGIALSIFLGFRNNACYDRWWEGRRDWGQLVYTVRGFARQTLMLEAAGETGCAARRDLLRLTMAFAQALVCHLRPGVTRVRSCVIWHRAKSSSIARLKIDRISFCALCRPTLRD